MTAPLATLDARASGMMPGMTSPADSDRRRLILWMLALVAPIVLVAGFFVVQHFAAPVTERALTPAGPPPPFTRPDKCNEDADCSAFCIGEEPVCYEVPLHNPDTGILERRKRCGCRPIENRTSCPEHTAPYTCRMSLVPLNGGPARCRLRPVLACLSAFDNKHAQARQTYDATGEYGGLPAGYGYRNLECSPGVDAGGEPWFRKKDGGVSCDE